MLTHLANFGTEVWQTNFDKWNNEFKNYIIIQRRSQLLAELQ